MKVTADNLISHLTHKGLDPKIQKETGQVYLIVKANEIEFPFFLRIFEQSELLQLLLFMPVNIKPGTHADLARLLHLINKELDIPGFGMDESAAVVFYRCMLPIPGADIPEKLLDTFIKSIELIAESITPPVIGVATGAATFADILAQAKEIQK